MLELKNWQLGHERGVITGELTHITFITYNMYSVFQTSPVLAHPVSSLVLVLLTENLNNWKTKLKVMNQADKESAR